MADASNLQTSFLGGEWSLTAQGRQDDPKYKMAMNVCFNAFPLEEGAWTRRPGFALAGFTDFGHQTYVFPFNYDEGAPYTVEIDSGPSANVTRLWSGTNHVFDSAFQIYSIQATTPITISIDPAAPYNTGDVINVLVTSGANGSLAEMMNRDFYLTKVATGIYTLTDPITGANAAAAISNWNGTTMTASVARVLVLANPYVVAGDAAKVNVAMAGSSLILYHPNYPTQYVQINTLDSADPRFSTFSTGVWLFSDGPYYNSVFGQVSTPNAQSGNIQLTLTGGFGPNQASPTSADVGRLVRLLSEPLLWQSGTTYALNAGVVYPAGTGTGPGNYYTSLISSNVGNNPETNPQAWAINPQAAQWTFATITAVSGNTINITLPGPNAPQLDYSNPINYWQLGLFGGTNGWPTAGSVHEGRLWSVWTNYICGSRPFAAAQSYNDMAPTDLYGNVSDASGITYQLVTGSETSNQLFWVESGPQGMVAGSAAGEWNIKASSLIDPITPTSIQAARVTKYGCANVQPTRSGFTVLFVQRFFQRVLELVSDVFTGKFAAPNLSLRARHIGRPGFTQIQWAETPNPILWTINKLGGLAGCTYRRLTSFISEEPTFVGWHRHSLPGTSVVPNRVATSIAVGPDPTGTYDALTMVANAPNIAGKYVVEVSQRVFQEGDTLDSAYFLDDSRAPTAMIDSTGTGVVLSGFWPLVGLPVTAFIAGLNCGTYTVDGTGSITVPYLSDPDRLFTAAYLASYPSTGAPGMSTSGAVVVTTPPGGYSATPASIGEFVASTASTTVVSADWGNGYTFFYDESTTTLKSFNTTTRAQIASVSVPANQLMLGAGQDSNFYTQGNDQLIHRYPVSTLSPVTQFGTAGASNYYYLAPLFDNAAMCAASGKLWLAGIGGSGPYSLSVFCLSDGVYADFDVAPAFDYQLQTGSSGGPVGSIFGINGAFGTSVASLSVIAVTIGASARGNITSYNAWSNSAPYGTGSIVTHSNQLWIATSPTLVTDVPGVAGDWSSYAVPNQTGIAMTVIGTLACTAVDAAWTSMSVPDFGYDQTDGNLIAFATGSNSNCYLIKINSVTAALMWKLKTTGNLNTTGLGFSNITNAVFGFLDQSGNVYAVNTLAGTVNLSFTIAGCTQTPSGAEQLYNGVSQQLYTRFAYNSGTTGAPSPLSGTAGTFTDWAEYIPFNVFAPIAVSISSITVPALVGIPFTSIGQRLRPGMPQEAGAQNGPPQAKTRRSHMYSAMLNSTPGYNLSIGTTAANALPVTFKSDGGTPFLYSQAFSGVKWDVLSDNYSFDSMTYWSATGPYPVVLASIGNFLHAMDR